MNHATTVVISVDGLTTAALSCYGSSWNETPALDSLAARGCVWDRLIATSTSPLDVLSSWMQHGDGDDWITSFRELGKLLMLTDDPRVADLQWVSRLDGVQCVDDLRKLRRPRDTIDQTRLGRLVAAAVNCLSETQLPSLLWLHTSSLTTVWDAPRFLALVDDWADGDTGPSDEVELLSENVNVPEKAEPIEAYFSDVIPPTLKLPDDRHPDLVTSWMRTYGCQVRLLDTLVGMLQKFEPLAEATFVVVGTSGFALGENGWMGASAGPVRSPRIRLPLIVGNQSPLRVGQLTSSSHLNQVLSRLGRQQLPLVTAAEWIREQSEFEPQVVTTCDDAKTVLTTPRWFFVHEVNDDRSLFLKPDDVDDANNVVRLRDDVCEFLENATDRSNTLML